MFIADLLLHLAHFITPDDPAARLGSRLRSPYDDTAWGLAVAGGIPPSVHTLDAQQEHAEVLQVVDFMDLGIDLLLLALRIAGTFPRTFPQVCEVSETLHEWLAF